MKKKIKDIEIMKKSKIILLQKSQQYQATQYSQPPNSYQMLASNMQAQAHGQFQEGDENQYAYISHLNQNNQSLQPNQIIYQPKMQNIS